MRATIKNRQDPNNMSISGDINVLETPQELMYQIVKKHPFPERLLGAANAELLKKGTIFFDELSFVLNIDGKDYPLDSNTKIYDYIVNHREVFKNISVPTFIVNVSYVFDECFSPEYSLYDDYQELMAKYCSNLIFDGLHQFSFSPHHDGDGVTGADINVSVNDDLTYHYCISIECRGYDGETMFRRYKYKSMPIVNKDTILSVKKAILYDEIDNYTYGVKVHIEDDLGNSGIRVIISEETDYSDSADYLTEIYDFESVIESILKCIQER